MIVRVGWIFRSAGVLEFWGKKEVHNWSIFEVLFGEGWVEGLGRV